MRTIYLIRHGQAHGESRCIGSTDLPLNEIGLRQAEALRRWMKPILPNNIFSSPYRRCWQTAEIMAGGHVPVEICGGLKEMSVGEWENLTFDEIRTQYPKEYELRGRHPGTVPPPGGENFIQAGLRMLDCIGGLLAKTQGDMAIVAHGGINRGCLCSLMALEPDKILDINQPWGGISLLKADNDFNLNVEFIGVKPNAYPDSLEQEQLLAKHKAPAAIREHGLAVARQALIMADRIKAPVNRGLLQAACVLHDIARDKGLLHPAQGAKLLSLAGYPLVAEIIAAHHDLPQNASLEAQLLYLADKQLCGTQYVSLQERFISSRNKCTTPEALAIWQRRYDDAMDILQKYHTNSV